MSLLLAALVAAAPATVPACSWDRPGVDPFTGDVVAAVDRYTDIPAPVRQALKRRMAQRAYDEIVSIRRDAIVGRAQYDAEIRDMHFGGAGRVCASVTRAGWPAAAEERGLVYCESGHCILVPTVCRNVSRIQRRAPVAAAAAAATAGHGETAGAAVPMVVAQPTTNAAAGTPTTGEAAPGPIVAAVAAPVGGWPTATGQIANASFGQLAGGADFGGGGVWSGPAGEPLTGPGPQPPATGPWTPSGQDVGGGAPVIPALPSGQWPGAQVTIGGQPVDPGVPEVSTPVPEPGTAALWLAGLALAGARLRRRGPR